MWEQRLTIPTEQKPSLQLAENCNTCISMSIATLEASYTYVLIPSLFIYILLKSIKDDVYFSFWHWSRRDIERDNEKKNTANTSHK